MLSLPLMPMWQAQGQFAFYLHITRSSVYPKPIVNSVTSMTVCKWYWVSSNLPYINHI